MDTVECVAVDPIVISLDGDSVEFLPFSLLNVDVDVVAALASSSSFLVPFWGMIEDEVALPCGGVEVSSIRQNKEFTSTEVH